MSSILITLGVLGLMVSLVLLVINVIRKKPKKKMMIAALVFFIISGIGFEMAPEEESVIAEDEELEVEVEEKEPEEKKEFKEVDKPKKEEQETEKVEETNISQSDLEEASLELMRENFQGMATVSYNDESKSYNLLPTDDDLIMELNLLVSGNPNVVDGWNDLVDGVQYLSGSLKGTLGNGYAINLLNPANTDNVFLTCIDGVVFYNVIDDL